MIYFVDYHLDSYIALIIDKFNYSIRTIYAPIGIASKGIPIDDVNPPKEIMHYFMIDDMETFRYYYLQYPLSMNYIEKAIKKLEEMLKLNTGVKKWYST